MKETTLCYIFRDEEVLMLYRNKKKEDANRGKWIGVGGKLENSETPEQCLLREVFEETGLKLTSYRKCGEIRFILDAWEDEITYLYTADGFEGEPELKDFDCEEGRLEWIPRDRILELNLWEGDRIFLKDMLQGRDVNLTLHYDVADNLIEIKNGLV
ncbi:MAG: 8-oxo-dGTP diphosphatase [Eubacteriaceae bacterium]|nr:8-oxo-dGTP diphosphatase [Eubacteriaceae bacterium]